MLIDVSHELRANRSPCRLYSLMLGEYHHRWIVTAWV